MELSHNKIEVETYKSALKTVIKFGREGNQRCQSILKEIIYPKIIKKTECIVFSDISDLQIGLVTVNRSNKVFRG